MVILIQRKICLNHKSRDSFAGLPSCHDQLLSTTVLLAQAHPMLDRSRPIGGSIVISIVHETNDSAEHKVYLARLLPHSFSLSPPNKVSPSLKLHL